jgi:predicted dehydrogenase
MKEITIEPNRRTLLEGLATVPLWIPVAVPGANDGPALDIVGVGNRGSWLHETFQKLGGQCVAVCDVYQPNLERAPAKSPKGAKAYVNDHDLRAQPGIDFVVIATPDPQHPSQPRGGTGGGRRRLPGEAAFAPPRANGARAPARAQAVSLGVLGYSAGSMTGQGTHLTDVVQAMTNSGPSCSAACQGRRIGNPQAEVPDVLTAVFGYPEFLAQDPDRDGVTARRQPFLYAIRLRQELNGAIEVVSAAVAGPLMSNLWHRDDRKVQA